jgi:hypothetical protein
MKGMMSKEIMLYMLLAVLASVEGNSTGEIPKIVPHFNHNTRAIYRLARGKERKPVKPHGRGTRPAYNTTSLILLSSSPPPQNPIYSDLTPPFSSSVVSIHVTTTAFSSHYISMKGFTTVESVSTGFIRLSPVPGDSLVDILKGKGLSSFVP